MVLCIDVGNTNIVFAGYEDTELKFLSRIKTDTTWTSDQYAASVRAVLTLYGFGPSDFEGAIIGSVVPVMTSLLRTACTRVFGSEPLILGAGLKTGLNIRLDNPAECGADLVASAVAAKNHFPLPLLVVDLGTASKITAVDKNGDFLGGAILPGLMTSVNALVSNASLLTDFELAPPTRAIGRNTPECLRSGYILGFASMIDGMCQRFIDELGEDATVVATGGLIDLVMPSCTTKMHKRDDLVTEGLRLIYAKNR